MATPHTKRCAAQDMTEPTTESLYRDSGAALALRRAAAQRRYQRQTAELLPELVAAYSRRAARVWFGVIAAVGGVAMFSVALAQLMLDALAGYQEAPTQILLATWTAALLAYAVARALAPRDVYAELARIAATSGDPHTDIARMQAYTPVQRTAFLINRKEHASVVWPLIGLALIGPLSLHGLFVLPFNSAATFSEWIQISALLVGHCHVFAALFSLRFARQTRRVAMDTPIHSVVSWCPVFWYTVALALLPAVLPTVVVAITGLVYFPLAYGWIARAVTRERTSIVNAAEPHPRGVI